MDKFVIIMLVIFLSGCHYHDNRLKGKNESQIDIIIAVCRQSPTQREDIISPFFRLKVGEKRSLYLLKDFDYSTLEEDSIAVVVAPLEFEEKIKWENGYYEYEKIFSEKKYEFHNIATNDIVGSLFPVLVNYPKSKFKTP